MADEELKRKRDDSPDVADSKKVKVNETVKDNSSELDTKSNEHSTVSESEESKQQSKDTISESSSEVKDEVKEDEPKKDKVDESKDSVSDKSKDEKPKFVFGSSSAFTGGFGVAKGKEDKKDTENQTETPKAAFSFGSGLSFGSGFNVLKTKDIAANKEEKDSKSKPEDSDDKLIPNSELKKEDSKVTSSNNAAPTPIKLQKQEVKSGEESEECLFQVNAKLFQLVDMKTGWKERGVGAVKVNRDKETSKTRVVMRSRGILKVILNLPLVKGFKVEKGFPGSLQSQKYVRIVALNENNEPTQYALRTGKEETADDLYENIKGNIPN